jgi:hypothetical protein
VKPGARRYTFTVDGATVVDSRNVNVSPRSLVLSSHGAPRVARGWVVAPAVAPGDDATGAEPGVRRVTRTFDLKMVAHIFTSSNPLISWLRQIEALRTAA